jgi:hypothetical protein
MHHHRVLDRAIGQHAIEAQVQGDGLFHHGPGLIVAVVAFILATGVIARRSAEKSPEDPAD